MAAVTAQIAFDRLYSTTTANHRPTMAMEIVQSNALLWHMYRQGAVHYAGGPEIRMPVVLETSQNVGAINLYQTFSTSPEDGPDVARYYQWYKNRASVVFDETELGQNQGPEQVLDLLKVKLAIAKHSMINDINRQLYADAGVEAATPTGATNEINGLASFIETQPEANQSETFGSIQKASYDRWRNRYGQMTAFSVDGLQTWEQVYMECSERGTHPDIIMADPQVYRFFKRLVQPNQERKDTAMWNQGFDNLLFNNTPVVPEPELAGSGLAYFLTTTGKRQVSDFNLKPEYFTVPGKNPMAKSAATGVGLQLAILRKDDFRMTPFRYPPDSDTLLAHCFFTCMLSSSSLSRHGVTDFSGGNVQF